MATGTITANLNGGDSVTAKENLIFKIYGATDGYTSAIHTTGAASVDADVSIVGDVVTIENVDVGVESDFKITSVDQALNEADKSPAYVIADVDLVTELGADLLVWLKDSTDNANLTQDGTKASAWLDGSGNSKNAVQATAGSQPLLDADGLKFDGTDDMMEVTFGTSLTAFEMFFIINNVASAPNEYVFDFQGTGKVLLKQAGGPTMTLYSYINTTQVNSTIYTIGTKIVGRFVINNASSSFDGNALNIGGVAGVTKVNIGARADKGLAANVILKEIAITNLLDTTKRTSVLNRLNSLVA